MKPIFGQLYIYLCRRIKNKKPNKNRKERNENTVYVPSLTIYRRPRFKWINIVPNTIIPASVSITNDILD